MARFLGLDYGRRRIGVAISDELLLTAQPVDTWEGAPREEITRRIEELIRTREVKKIILGLPLSLSGEKSSMTREVERFAEHLRKSLALPVILWDERLSSVQSKKVLQSMGIKTGKNKSKVDRMAAVLLLQCYLDHLEEEESGRIRREDC